MDVRELWIGVQGESEPREENRKKRGKEYNVQQSQHYNIKTHCEIKYLYGERRKIYAYAFHTHRTQCTTTAAATAIQRN